MCVYICTYTYVYLLWCVCMYVCVCVFICIYIYMYVSPTISSDKHWARRPPPLPMLNINNDNIIYNSHRNS